MTLTSRKTKSDRATSRKIHATQVKKGKYCEGIVYTYGDYQAEVRGPRARFTEPCSRCGVQGVVSHVGFIEPEL